MLDGPQPGWTSALLKDIVVSQKGKRPAVMSALPSKGFVPYLDIQAIEKGQVTSYAEATSSRLGSNNEILVVWDGARSGWPGLGQNGAIGSTIVALTPKPGVGNRYYLYRWLQSQFDRINAKTRGTGIPHVDPGVFWNLEVPLPPLSEQRRIVTKLDQLLAKVEACQERLDKIPIHLKRFRRSVLTAACSGCLTADWRGNDGYERDMPANWKAAKLGDLTALVTSGSRGWAKYYSPKGALFIRAQNINADYLDLSDIAYVALPNRAEGLRTKVKKNDLLVTITGANVTKSAIVLDELDNTYVSQHVALVRLKDIRLSTFLFLWLLSPTHGRAQLLESAYGQGKPGLNLDNIRNVDVWLPPLPEQHEIVLRVEALFKIADRIEERYRKARAHVDKLTQSILAKAFRGELVPQNPNDEPASALIERIRAAKIADGPTTKAVRTRARRRKG